MTISIFSPVIVVLPSFLSLTVGLPHTSSPFPPPPTLGNGEKLRGMTFTQPAKQRLKLICFLLQRIPICVKKDTRTKVFVQNIGDSPHSLDCVRGSIGVVSRWDERKEEEERGWEEKMEGRRGKEDRKLLV